MSLSPLSKQPIYAPLVQAIRNRLRLLYESSLIILEGIENHATVISVKNNVHDKWEEVLRIVGSHRLHYQFQQLVRQGRAFLCKDCEFGTRPTDYKVYV